jgi:hypothetical protein
MEAVQKIRRCKEDRDDFTRSDGSLWPMPIQKGGPSYGFCPGKATWSIEAAELLGIIELTYFTKSLYYPGSISEQPSWYVELIKDLLPFYESSKAAHKHSAMWGGGDKKPENKNAAPKTPGKRPRRRR